MSGVAPTRERIVVASSALFSRQGYNGTGIKQIAADAKAPFGSIYHFFPGGKEELGAEVIRSSAWMYTAIIDEYLAGATDIVAATEACFAGAAGTLVAMDYADPCPIATMSMEMSSISEPIREACADAFTTWVDRIAEHLRAAGVEAGAAREAATSVLALLEGAFMLGRAHRSRDPVLASGRAAAAVVSAVVRPG